MHDNLNAVEDLMKVNSKLEDKASVFEKYRNQYHQHFARNEELEKQR